MGKRAERWRRGSPARPRAPPLRRRSTARFGSTFASAGSDSASPISLLALLSKSPPPLLIDDWRDIAFCWDYTKPARLRILGANSVVTDFGNEYEALSWTDALSQPG
ncbi:hypothetical protein COCNU_07G000770 [Cocos nucifera]|uniref:Uncharacterized protein n=1 Tax=Cocos nucifera TaxID=13894 RepID=A0A8K0IDL4_COCNU|nr:hypothetical protein COCNU_07G000770 [Cocos nucifera]